MFYNIVSVKETPDEGKQFLFNECFNEDEYRVIRADQMKRNISDDPDSLEMSEETKKFMQVILTGIYYMKHDGAVAYLVKCREEKTPEMVEEIVRNFTVEQAAACRINLEELEKTEKDEGND